MRIEGHKITGVTITWNTLTFHTPEGDATYQAEGECCSQSYFYDIAGIGLLTDPATGPVISLQPRRLGQPQDIDSARGDCVEAYGYEIVAERHGWRDNDRGEQVVAAFSFRNDSNGYYGGYLIADGEYLFPS